MDDDEMVVTGGYLHSGYLRGGGWGQRIHTTKRRTYEVAGIM